MNKRQERAIGLIMDEVSECVNGFRRVMMDYPDYSDEYQYARKTLRNHDALVDYVYEYMMTGWGSEPKDLRFCGKKWLYSQISNHAKSIGY